MMEEEEKGVGPEMEGVWSSEEEEELEEVCSNTDTVSREVCNNVLGSFCGGCQDDTARYGTV